MEIKAVIIDDEENNILNLQSLLKQYCPELIVVATARHATSGVQNIMQHKPDIVFLDIEMPDQNGFDLLRSLPEHNFEIVFVTAHQQYGIQAVKFAAIDYLLKPINIDELKMAVAKAVRKRVQRKNNIQLENLMLLLKQQPKAEHRIALPTAKETRLAKTDEIIRCESLNNYTNFYFANGEKLMVSKPIYEYEELLQDYQFIRCHQSHLVNKKYIKSWVKEDGGYLLLEDKTQVPISRQKKEAIKNLLLL
jgi:two-component system, LytTR family, response regulator